MPTNVAPASGPEAARFTTSVNPLAVGVMTPSPLRGAVEVGKVIEPLYVPSPVATSVPP